MWCPASPRCGRSSCGRDVTSVNELCRAECCFAVKHLFALCEMPKRQRPGTVRPAQSSAGGISRKGSRKLARASKKAQKSRARVRFEPSVAAAASEASRAPKAASSVRGTSKGLGRNQSFFQSVGVVGQSAEDSDPEDEDIRRLERKLGLRPSLPAKGEAVAQSDEAVSLVWCGYRVHFCQTCLR